MARKERADEPTPRPTRLLVASVACCRSFPTPTRSSCSRPLPANPKRERGGVWGGRRRACPERSRTGRPALPTRSSRTARTRRALPSPFRRLRRPICPQMAKPSKLTNGRPFGQWTDTDIKWTSTRSLPDPFPPLLRGGHVRTISELAAICLLSTTPLKWNPAPPLPREPPRLVPDRAQPTEKTPRVSLTTLSLGCIV